MAGNQETLVLVLRGGEVDGILFQLLALTLIPALPSRELILPPSPGLTETSQPASRSRADLLLLPAAVPPRQLP